MAVSRRAHPAQLALPLVVGLAVGVGLMATSVVGPWSLDEPPSRSPGLLLMVDQTPASDAQTPIAPLRLREVDPDTLAPRPERASLDFGHHWTHTVSPDGRTLAAFIWPRGDTNGGGALHLIDLTTWTDSVAPVQAEDGIAGLAFSHDGRRLYWVRPVGANAEYVRSRARQGCAQHHGTPEDYALFVYDLTTRASARVLDLPPLFAPLPPQALPDGRLAVYGIPLDPRCGIGRAADAPGVLLIEPAAGRLAATIRLTGVKAGRVPMGGADLYDVQDMWPGLAWDHPRQRLYIAHADEDRLTVVDLQQGRLLAQTVIRPRASLLGYLADWLIPTTVAKGNNAISRAALLSPDGRRLYVWSTVPPPPGPRPAEAADRCLEVTRVQAVDTQTLQEVDRWELPCAGGMNLTPDGGHLVITTFLDDERSPAAAGPPGRHELTIIDQHQPAPLESVPLAGPTVLHGVSPDGRYAYVSVLTGMVGAPPRPAWVVRVFDLTTRQFVAERALENWFEGALIAARARQ